MGIRLTGVPSDIAIFNGHIQGSVTQSFGFYDGPGFAYGIYYSAAPPRNTRVSNVSVSGCLYYGIYLELGDSLVVENCTVRTVASVGIWASTVRDCSVVECGHGIFGDQVTGCRVKAIGDGSFAIHAITAMNCIGESSRGTGILASNAFNCFGTCGNTGYGLSAVTAQNCSGISSNSPGLGAETAMNCHGQSFNNPGIYTVTANSCEGISVAGEGILAYMAENCRGQSETNYAIESVMALNCYGRSNGSGVGVSCTGAAQNCYGYSATGTGLSASLINFCIGVSYNGGAALSGPMATGSLTLGGTNAIGVKYNMPP
jgi:hypothetical protein